jgi:hypothetical protein
MMVDRPATTSTLLTVASGQDFSTSLVPTAVGNATKVFDVDSAATDTSISGAYIDEIFFRYSKRVIEKIDAKAVVNGTYSANGTTVTITISGGHNLEVGQDLFADFTSHSSGTDPIDQKLTVTAVTPTTFQASIAAVSGTITGNVSCSLPTDICFYIANVGTISNINQFFPIFVASIPSTAANQSFSLTESGDLPLINHPVVQAGSNFDSANSKIAPKARGLMLKRGQALYAAASGASALTNGFYVGIQGGFY